MSWQDMSSAPRDGTVVELMCTYGVAPWYGLFRWTKECLCVVVRGDTQNLEMLNLDKPEWVSVDRVGHGVSGEDTLQWRPYHGNSAAYVDPTGGAQMTAGYWRQARGLPHSQRAREPLFDYDAGAGPPGPTLWQRFKHWYVG